MPLTQLPGGGSPPSHAWVPAGRVWRFTFAHGAARQHRRLPRGERDGPRRPSTGPPRTRTGRSCAIDLNDRSVTTVHRRASEPAGALRERGTAHIWETEHAARGGDELNLLADGQNYGYPSVSYGTTYDAMIWPSNPATRPARRASRSPTYVWMPSVGISQVLVLQKGGFPYWQGDVIVASMAMEHLYRVRTRGWTGDLCRADAPRPPHPRPRSRRTDGRSGREDRRRLSHLPDERDRPARRQPGARSRGARAVARDDVHGVPYVDRWRSEPGHRTESPPDRGTRHRPRARAIGYSAALQRAPWRVDGRRCSSEVHRRIRPPSHPGRPWRSIASRTRTRNSPTCWHVPRRRSGRRSRPFTCRLPSARPSILMAMHRRSARRCRTPSTTSTSDPR
jgi:hypothetical protein